MYDTAKLFRPLLVSVFLGLLLVDVSLADQCKEFGLTESGVVRKWHSSKKSACEERFNYAKEKNPGYSAELISWEGAYCYFKIFGFYESHSYHERKCPDDKKCQSKKGQKFRDGNFTYELTGKGKGEQVAFSAGFFGKPVGTCDNGCAVSGSYLEMKQIHPGKENEKSWISATNATYTGGTCSVTGDSLGLPNAPAEPSPDQPQPDPKDGIAPGWSSAPKPNEDGAPVCPKGRCPAQVNGMDICVDCDVTMSSASTSKKTESTTKPSTPASGSGDGSGGGDGNGSGSGSGDGKSTSSEESQSVTKCQGGLCETTTKTKNKDSKGTKETTTTTKQSQSDYCQKNPQDEANCALKFGEKKKGDGEGDDPCKKDPKRIGCLSLGEPTKGENTTKNSQEVRYQEGQFSTGSGCPSAKTFRAFGQTYKLDFTKFCEMAKYLKPLVLLVASIFTMFIVINGLKK